MSESFKQLCQKLKGLPGFGVRSSERVALHLLLEKRELAEELVEVLQNALEQVGACPICGNMTEGGALCSVCANERRNKEQLCIVEHVPDLISMERMGGYEGVYHVLHGRLSPLRGIYPGQLNFESLKKRLIDDNIKEVILALPNDVESEATCHYIVEEILKGHDVEISRIGFGLPSGGSILYADTITLRNALESRRKYD